ncbi:MAG: hypothetical protein QXH60_03020, partial [Candidatus Pacearchaeota archaeon]
SLIIFALTFRLFYSVFSDNYSFFVFGLFGLAVLFIVGHLLYYARVFAGGDAKLFIALGSVIPFASDYYLNTLIFFLFLISLLAGGALYSIAYTLFLVYKNKEEFKKEFRKNFNSRLKLFISLIFVFFIFLLFSLMLKNFIIILFPLFLILTFFLYIYAKSIEKTCMFVYTNPKRLTVGDWLAETIMVKGKKIEPYWEGLSQEQIDFIKKYYKKPVLVKQGIPFSPAFLIAFLVILYIQFLGNADWGLWKFNFFF